MKNFLVVLVFIVLAAIGAFAFFHFFPGGLNATQNNDITSDATSTSGGDQVATSSTATGPTTVIGKSVDGSDITAYNFGSGAKKILFVGGLHGGYEWNTALVAYQLIDYLKANPTAVPAGVQVTVIPVVNPDGLKKVVGKVGVFTASDVNPSATVQVAGRFNTNTVDLNRNFDCDWKASGVWQSKTVSGGSAVFSEPETQAMKQYIESSSPDAVVVWYSSAGGVYSSSCHDGVLPETTALTNLYAKASGYPPHEVFNYYEITGDMVNWLAKQKIPAISVLLTNHTDTEWTKNLAGVQAVLQHYAQ